MECVVTYNTFATTASSEKITLAVLEASKRLMGWSLHSGAVYSIPFTETIVTSVKDSGTSLTEGSSTSLSSNSYYLDAQNEMLYIRMIDDSNPNGKYVSTTFKMFFATAPVTLPHDLASGEEVYWSPSIESTSRFGVELDTIKQMGEAIEGSGTLSLYNERAYWSPRFDKYVFDNQNCLIYSWNRDLLPSEAKLLFKGKVESRTWSDKKISFKLKDLVSILRDTISTPNLVDVAGARIPTNMQNAKQRMILGRLFGHRPTNIDEVLDGYPVTGTIAVTTSSETITGTGTSFLSELCPDDQISIAGEKYTVATIASDTSLTVSSTYTGASESGLSTTVVPSLPKRYTNRVWKLSGHVLRQPETIIAGGATVNRLVVQSTRDFFAGDQVYIGTLGSGELVTIDEVLNDTTCILSTSLNSIPSIDTPVLRPCVQDVRINDVRLEFYRDYTVDADTGTLTLLDNAERNAGPIREMVQNITFTNGSRSVTGSGFEGTIEPGYMLRVRGNAAFFQVLSVESDTALTLTEVSTYTDTDKGQYSSLIFDPTEHVLSCEILGRTNEGTTEGVMPRTGPEIVKLLLTDAGLSGVLDNDSFTDTSESVPFDIAFVVPSNFKDNKTFTYREIVNNVNKSIFGAIIQDQNFQLKYTLLEPKKPVTARRLMDSDILKLSVKSTASEMVRRVVVEYNRKEYDYEQGDEGINYATQSSQTAEYILGTSRERTFSCYLTQQSSAIVLANRWSFLLEYSAGSITIETKLQTIDLDINDVIDIDHRDLYERLGGTSKRKIVAIERISKSGSGVVIEAVDLSNAFNRVCIVNDITSDYSDTAEEDRLYGGFVTDEYGLIDNEAETFGSNVIW